MGAVAASGALAREADYGRLPSSQLDVTSPSDRVRGSAAEMTARNNMACRSLSLDQARRRIVDIAVQEWGFFGFPIIDYTNYDDDTPYDPAAWRFRFPSLPSASFQGVNSGLVCGRQNQVLRNAWALRRPRQ